MFIDHSKRAPRVPLPLSALGCLAALMLILAPAPLVAQPAVQEPKEQEEEPPKLSPAQLQNQKGVAAYKARKLDKAVRAFEKARLLAPNDVVIAQNLARALHGLAIDQYKRGDFDQALQGVRRASGYDDKEPLFLVLESKVLGSQGRSSEARACLRNGLELHPGSAHLFEALGRIEYKEEFLEEALQCLETAARLDPEHAKSFANFLAKVRREVKVEARYFKDVRGIFTVKFDDAAFKDVGTALLEMLDKTYDRLATDFRFYPRDRLTVVLYTRGDYNVATNAHQWTAGLYDGKIRLPVRNFRRVAKEVETTLTHELTHWFIRKMTKGCPLWLNEGLAQYCEGRRPSGITNRFIQTARDAGKLKAFAKLPSAWSGIKDASTVRVYYSQSLHFVDFLIRRYGFSAVSACLESLKPKTDFKQIFRRAFGSTLEELEAEWLRE